MGGNMEDTTERKVEEKEKEKEEKIKLKELEKYLETNFKLDYFNNSECEYSYKDDETNKTYTITIHYDNLGTCENLGKTEPLNYLMKWATCLLINDHTFKKHLSIDLT